VGSGAARRLDETKIGRRDRSRLADEMRATVVVAYGGPEALELHELDAPEPARGEVAIDVAYAGVNYAEVMARRGALPPFQPPFVPGLEVSGRVRALGEGVDGLRPGQPVSALTTRGGYAEVAVAPAALTYPVSGGSDDDLRRAAALPTVVPTAWALIHEVARLRGGETVLVHAAAGGVGTVVGQVARRAGAGRVLGVVSSPEKARYAQRFGYDAVLVGPGWADQAAAAVDGRGFDVILDSIGGETRARSFELLAPLGRLVLFGNASDAPETGVPGHLLRVGAKATLGWSITGLAAAAPERVRAIARDALGAVARGELRVDITEVLPLAQAPRAHAMLEGRRSTGKLVLAVA
jgi:NADPH2:quinone reductase